MGSQDDGEAKASLLLANELCEFLVVGAVELLQTPFKRLASQGSSEGAIPFGGDAPDNAAGRVRIGTARDRLCVDIGFGAVEVDYVARVSSPEHAGPKGGRLRVEFVDVEVGVLPHRSRRSQELGGYVRRDQKTGMGNLDDDR